MGTLLVGFLNGFLELGAESLLIREREATRAHCDTAWTIRLIQGAVLALLLVGLAVPVSDFFGEPRLVDVIYLIALSAFIEGFDNIGMVLVRKELDFAKDFRFGIYNRIAVFLFTVSFAFALRSYLGPRHRPACRHRLHGHQQLFHALLSASPFAGEAP